MLFSVKNTKKGLLIWWGKLEIVESDDKMLAVQIALVIYRIVFQLKVSNGCKNNLDEQEDETR